MTETYRGADSFGPRAERHSSRNWLSGRMIFGLLLLGFGALWTLDNLDIVEAGSITRYWPVILLAWGLCLLTGLACRRRPMAGVIWTLIGGWLLLWELELVEYSIFDLWPVVLIFIGALLVFRAGRGRSFRSPETENDPVLNTFVVMGGAERKVVAESFRGGEVNAVMGGAEIDLRSAKLASHGATVDVFAMFGGVELIVPEGWRVIGKVTPILGGFEDGTVPPLDPAAPTLTVQGMAIMGGVEVNHGGGAERRARRRAWRDECGYGRPSRAAGDKPDNEDRNPDPEARG
jgi:predicted membrane protein